MILRFEVYAFESVCMHVHSLQRAAEESDFKAATMQRERNAWRAAEETLKVGGIRHALSQVDITRHVLRQIGVIWHVLLCIIQSSAARKSLTWSSEGTFKTGGAFTNSRVTRRHVLVCMMYSAAASMFLQLQCVITWLQLCCHFWYAEHEIVWDIKACWDIKAAEVGTIYPTCILFPSFQVLLVGSYVCPRIGDTGFLNTIHYNYYQHPLRLQSTSITIAVVMCCRLS